jgi:hypothetical protein
MDEDGEERREFESFEAVPLSLEEYSIKSDPSFRSGQEFVLPMTSPKIVKM